MIEDMRVRNLSLTTQRVYIDEVVKFAKYFGKSPALLGPEDVRTYQVHLVYGSRMYRGGCGSIWIPWMLHP